MAAPSQFRVSADVVASWKETLSTYRSVKGIEPILKEVLDALLAQSADGYVAVERHKVFSWAESLRGAAMRADAQGNVKLNALADDMKSYMMGQVSAAASPPPVAAQPPAPAASTATASVTAGAPVAAAPAPAPYVAPPPVVYAKPGATASWAAGPPATGAGAMRLVTERELPGLVAQLLREARGEVIVVAPWNGGLDTIIRDLVLLPQNVALRVLTRRAQPEDESWHRALQDLQRRKADVVISPLLHTRCIIVDGQKLLLGAAGAPLAVSKEMGILVTDPALANEARLNVGRLWQEARDGH